MYCAPPAEAGSWSPESLACVRSPAAVPHSDAAPPPHSDWSDSRPWLCEVTQDKQNSFSEQFGKNASKQFNRYKWKKDAFDLNAACAIVDLSLS